MTGPPVPQRRSKAPKEPVLVNTKDRAAEKKREMATLSASAAGALGGGEGSEAPSWRCGPARGGQAVRPRVGVGHRSARHRRVQVQGSATPKTFLLS